MVFEFHILFKVKWNIDSFIDETLKLDDRFPSNESNVLYAFGVLGLWSISFLSHRELMNLGNESLEYCSVSLVSQNI